MQNYFLNTDKALVDHLFIAVMLHLMVASQIFLVQFFLQAGNEEVVIFNGDFVKKELWPDTNPRPSSPDHLGCCAIITPQQWLGNFKLPVPKLFGWST